MQFITSGLIGSKLNLLNTSAGFMKQNPKIAGIFQNQKDTQKITTARDSPQNEFWHVMI
jgi:hypothetical protein